MSAEPKLGEIAKRISVHLRRMEEAQPKDGKMPPGRLYLARAFQAGSRLGIIYVNYQGSSTLRKADALEYLHWLDAGNKGRHYSVLGFNARVRARP